MRFSGGMEGGSPWNLEPVIKLMRRGFFIVIFLLTLPGWAAPSSELERVELSLREGRPEQALQQLKTLSGHEAMILKGEALLEARMYNEAADLIETLPLTGVLTPSWASRALLLRGRLAQLRSEHSEADRMFQDSERVAPDPEGKIRALDLRVGLWDSLEEWDKSESIIAKAAPLIPDLTSHALARHLVARGNFAARRGRRADGLSFLAGARALYQHLGASIRVADTELSMANTFFEESDREQAWSLAEQALAKYRQAQSEAKIASCLSRMVSYSYQLPQHREQIRADLEAALETLPPGRWRDSVRLELFKFAHQLRPNTTEFLSKLETLLERNGLDPQVRREALLLFSQVQAHAGLNEDALKTLKEAQHSTSSYFYSDPWRQNALGPILLGQALLLKDQQRFDQALETLRQAVEAQPGKDWTFWRGIAHYNGLLIAMAAYDLEAAREEFKAGLKMGDQLTTLSEKAGTVTNLLAALSVNQSLNHDLLEPGERALGPYDPLSETIISELLGGPEAGREFLELYDRWVAQSQAKDNAITLTAGLNYKAFFLEATGHLAEARACLVESLSLASDKNQPAALVVGHLLLARVEDRLGDRSAALVSLEKAAQHSLAFPVAGQAFYHQILAWYQLRQGLVREALASYQHVARLVPDTAWPALYGQAKALETLGRSDEALDKLEQALNFTELNSRPISQTTLLAEKGRLLVVLKRSEEALETFRNAFPTLLGSARDEKLLDLTLSYSQALLDLNRPEEALEVSVATAEAMRTRGTMSSPKMTPLLERVANLSLAQGKTEQALSYLEQSRSAELVGAVKLSNISHGNPATQSLLRELDRLKVRLEGLQSEAERSDQEARRSGVSKVLADTREEFFSKVDQLKRREPEFEALVQLSGSSLSAIQGALPEDTTLVEFFPSDETLYLFIVSSDALVLRQVLVGREQLARHVEHHLRLVREPESDSKALLESSRLLHSLVMEPALTDVRGKSRLRLVPSGPLWKVPFEELRDAQGVSLDKRFEVSMLTSADLLRTLTGSASASGGRVVLFGAPDGQDLPGAQAELRALSQALPGSILVEGRRANGAALRSSAEKADILHIASHSGAGEKPGECYIELSDGPYPLEKIYGLSLARGALVVLSSCRSATGEEAPGREVTSLASAFNIAGASTVIASHWEVDDAATAELFSAFYRHLRAGVGRGEALRRARQEVARTHPHPYYWAGFSLFGNPR